MAKRTKKSAPPTLPTPPETPEAPAVPLSSPESSNIASARYDPQTLALVLTLAVLAALRGCEEAERIGDHEEDL